MMQTVKADEAGFEVLRFVGTPNFLGLKLAEG